MLFALDVFFIFMLLFLDLLPSYIEGFFLKLIAFDCYDLVINSVFSPPLLFIVDAFDDVGNLTPPGFSWQSSPCQ